MSTLRVLYAPLVAVLVGCGGDGDSVSKSTAMDNYLASCSADGWGWIEGEPYAEACVCVVAKMDEEIDSEQWAAAVGLHQDGVYQAGEALQSDSVALGKFRLAMSECDADG